MNSPSKNADDQHLEEAEFADLLAFANNLSPSNEKLTVAELGSTETPIKKFNLSAPSIANFEVSKLLGQGGMGSVWKARQIHPVQRDLAIKIVHANRTSPEFGQRLEVERRALAKMEHAGIARMIAAGETDAGHPYYAMELFEGQRLDRYCDQHELNIQARLRLFQDICQAVAHAHQKGVIHRDLKPSNILVKSSDGQAIAKVIDFGLAKATDSLSALTDDQTAFGQVMGTFEFMSPEQANSDSSQLDSRTDIYSLGAILYQLVCGQTPLGDELSRRSDISKKIDAVVNASPPLPSKRLQNNETAASVCKVRNISINALQKFLVGDLDWIVMKAIDKAPDRRYQSASELAAEIDRFLKREPVLARPPSFTYRLGKFISNHRLAVAFTSLLCVALIAGIAGTTYGWAKALAAESQADQQRAAAEQARINESIARESESQRAESEKRAKERAEQLLAQTTDYNDVLRTIFSDLDPRLSPAKNAPLERRLADRLKVAGAQIAKNEYDDPKLQLQLLQDLGITLVHLGFPQEAIGFFEKSIDVVDSQIANDRRSWIAYTTLGFGKALSANGKHNQAILAYQKAVELYTDVDGADHKNTLSAIHGLATAYVQNGNVKNAIPLLKQIIPKREIAYGVNHKVTLISKSVLATAYQRSSRFELALKLSKEVLDARTQTLGEDAVGTITTTSNLADLHFRLGHDDQSYKLQAKAHAAFQKKLGHDHPNTLAVQTKLAMYLNEVGQRESALQLTQDAIPQLEQRLGKTHPRTLTAKALLAGILTQNGKVSEALTLIDPCYKMAVEEHGDTSANVLDLGVQRVSCLAAAGNVREAEEFGRRITANAIANLGDNHAVSAKAKLQLARVLYSQHDWQGAKETIESLLPPANNTSSVRTLRSANFELAKIWLALNKPAAAKTILEKLNSQSSTSQNQNLPTSLKLLRQLARPHLQLADWSGAEKLLAELIAHPSRKHPTWQLGFDNLLLATAKFATDQADAGKSQTTAGLKLLNENTDQIPFNTKPDIKAVLEKLSHELVPQDAEDLLNQIDQLTKKIAKSQNEKPAAPLNRP